MIRKCTILFFLCMSAFAWSGFLYPVMGAEPVMSTYTAYPLTLSSMVKPNVLVVLDTSNSMMRYAYSGGYNPATTYDGLFEPTALYSYDNTNHFFFTPKNTGDTQKGYNYWEGNFLNWVCTRRMDIAKIVLGGGEYIYEGGNHLIKGFTYPNSVGAPSEFQIDAKTYNYDGTGATETYSNHREDSTIGPHFQVNITGINTIDFYIRVKVNGPPTGIIQDMATMVRFGLEVYSPNNNANEGGKILAYIGSNAAAIVTAVNAQRSLSDPVGATCWTPMAETLVTAAGYFAQSSATFSPGPKYHSNDYTVSNTWDPYYSVGGTLACIKSFIIFISDGEANNDNDVPSYANQAMTGEITGADNRMDNVAHWMHITDLRPGPADFGGQTTTGTQNITLYTISAFGGGAALLQSAAKFGGFVDSNANNLPDVQSEWDVNSDTIPDNYYAANTVAELKDAMSKALVDILGKMASGSAVSMISTNNTGEASLVQAFFRPLRTATVSGESDVKWVGYLHSFWIDDEGNMREDTNGDRNLNVEEDDIIRFFTDVNGNVKLYRYDASATTPYPVTSPTTIDLADTRPIWDAGKRLADRTYDRTIYTYLDKDKDGVVDTDEVVAFNTTNSTIFNLIKPYLGVADATAWAYLGNTFDYRAENLIKWIRGTESGLSGSPDIRSRQIQGNIWKLGDIVNSSPVTISTPFEDFDLIYGDESYDTYYSGVSNRETMIYVGANDGMLHAFTSWKYDKLTETYVTPATAPSGERIGDEIWAYIPQALLPHLKWLPSKNYAHVYYVDLTPVAFDVRIFSPTGDPKHPGGWATIILCGLNMGGKNIAATGDFDNGSGVTVNETRNFSSSYFCMDVTDPRAPELLWERTYNGLGLTTSSPAVLKVQDKWFVAIGSGPTTYDGISNQEARIFVVDVKTGAPYSGSSDPWLFTGTSGTTGFMNSPVAFDMDLNYNVDSVYFAEQYYQSSSSSRSKIWKITIPWDWSDLLTYEDDPTNWVWVDFFSTNRPVSGKLNLSLDADNNVFCFFGTGRYFNEDDKANTNSQYLYGVQDPFYKDGLTSDYHINNQPTNLTQNDLWAASATATVDPAKFGWYYQLTHTGERNLTRAEVIGGYVLYTGFAPNQDLCGFGGDGYLYAFTYDAGLIAIESAYLGKGKPGEAAVYIRVPKEKTGGGGQQQRTVTLLLQSSTGEIINFSTPLSVPISHFTRWLEP